MTMRFYAACLASYNSGILYGKWIDASEDVAAMRLEIDDMLRGSPCPNTTQAYNGELVPCAEEYAIHDSEGLGNIGEYDSLQTIADYVTFYNECEEHGLGCIASDIKANELNPEDYAGKAYTLTAWCEEFMDETGELDAMPAHLRNYFDYEAYARDMEIGGDIVTIRHAGTLYVFWNR